MWSTKSVARDTRECLLPVNAASQHRATLNAPRRREVRSSVTMRRTPWLMKLSPTWKCVAERAQAFSAV
jgi:hypothetical protein